MVISEYEMRNPRWIRYSESEATLARDDRRRFDNMQLRYANQPQRSWRIQPQPGYNAQNPVIYVENIKLDTETPVIRAR